MKQLTCALACTLLTVGPGCASPARSGAPVHSPAVRVHEAITFARYPDILYLPVHEVAGALGWPLARDDEEEALLLRGKPVDPKVVHHLVDGATLIPLQALAQYGAKLQWNPARQLMRVEAGGKTLWVHRGAKGVVIDLTRQRLKAYQGGRLVLSSRVSTGRIGKSTPAGLYHADWRQRMHRSRLYDNAPMPYSVHLAGHIFIHGFQSVPRRPASHGCIRLPLRRGNPARWFYYWVDKGTPIRIVRSRPSPKKLSAKAERTRSRAAWHRRELRHSQGVGVRELGDAR